MAGSSEDYAVVPDAQPPGPQGGAPYQARNGGSVSSGQDPEASYSHLSPKMFTYGGQVAQHFMPNIGATSGMPSSVVPVLSQQQQQQQQQQRPSMPALPAHTQGQSQPQLRQQPGQQQQQQQPGSQQQMVNGQRLTVSQQNELEMARRRAEKAAEGKRANATAARRAKRRSVRTDDGDDGPASSVERVSHGHKDDIEARLATVEDEKEAKRLKRLLRNRVSAQQARERKKSYVSTLENKSANQDDKITGLQQRAKTLERENVMLRQIIKNMQQGSSNGPAVPDALPSMNATLTPALLGQ